MHNNFAQADDVFAEDATVESTDGPIDASAIRKRIYSGILEGKIQINALLFSLFYYFHLSNKHGGWNKCGGEAKVAKSINVAVGILQLESSPFVLK